MRDLGEIMETPGLNDGEGAPKLGEQEGEEEAYEDSIQEDHNRLVPKHANLKFVQALSFSISCRK